MDGDVLGTPCFMAPEQAQGRIAELGPRSDVYSVGAMLYHLLANAMPYVPAGASVGSRAVLDQLLQGPPRALFELRRDLPAELVAICERAMARDAQDRYPGMSNMADDLRAFLERRVVHAYETGAWAEAKMWVRRNKSLAASLAVAVLLLIAGLTASLVFKARSDENARIAAANEVRATEREQLALWRAADLAVATRTAQENEQVATQKANDVLSLSAIQDLMELADRADALWPASPENLPLYEAWLSDARILIEGQADDPVRGVKRRPGLAEHAAKLAEIRSRGRPVSADPGDAPRLPERASSLEYEFEDSGDRWWHAQLSKLVSDLEAFRDEQRGGLFSAGTSEEHGWGIEKRLEFARTIAERSVSGPQARARWEEASAAIEKLPEYRSLKLEPQLGLLPIGADPDSGLWEFAHLQTGDPAERDAHGKLVVDEAMGLVFVLLPGGTFPMGAQSADPAGANYDPQAVSLDEAPVHEVTLSPYFLSKYEMTQGQWRRFTGQNPSNHGPTQYSRSWNRAGKGWTALHPVEQVSWTQCMEVMARLGLSLPSEAQWENGARGGTDTPYWTGWDLESLLDAANLSDAYGKSHGNHAWNLWEKDLDDGNTSHAEIGSYRANPFGLHEVIGNVGEWCLDGYDAGFYARSPRLDPVNLSTGAPYRVLRGGGFNDDASRARSAIRNENAPEVPVFVLGLRPARALEPPPAASPSSEE
jgi:formylglycine-generating enzyme required for sulfatase activity